MTDTDWVGTHTLRLRCINGIYDPTAVRGNFGQYEHVYSDTFELELLNPCYNSESGIQLSFNIEDMTVPLGEDRLETNQPGPMDEISATYGGGSKTCGNIFYRITDDDR